MTNLSVIENKISSVRKYLKILERYKKYSRQKIEKDIDIRGAVERYLYLVCQATIDLTEAIIAYKNFRKPATLSESFYILNEQNIISDELTEKMIKMTGFRNIIVHDIVYETLKKRLKDIENFLEKIKSLT